MPLQKLPCIMQESALVSAFEESKCIWIINWIINWLIDTYIIDTHPFISLLKRAATCHKTPCSVWLMWLLSKIIGISPFGQSFTNLDRNWVSGFAKVKDNFPMKSMHIRKIRFAIFNVNWRNPVSNENWLLFRYIKYLPFFRIYIWKHMLVHEH